MLVSTTKVQNSFGKYLEMAKRGKQVYIEKNGKPVAVLRGLSEEERFSIREENVAYTAAAKTSYEQYLEIVNNEENERKYELIYGKVYMQASPRYEHQKIARELLVQFHSWFRDSPCEPLAAPLDVRLSGEAETFEENPNVVQPDILVLCDTEKVDEKGTYHGVPSLLVEILSPSTKERDLVLKLGLYQTSGIGEYWLIDPDRQMCILYSFEKRKLKDHQIVLSGGTISSLRFAGLAVDMATLFPES